MVAAVCSGWIASENRPCRRKTSHATGFCFDHQDQAQGKPGHAGPRPTTPVRVRAPLCAQLRALPVPAAPRKPARAPAVKVAAKPPAEKLAGRLEHIAPEYTHERVTRLGPRVTGGRIEICRAGRMVGTRQQLLSQIPDEPGNYLWCVKAPHARAAVPVYLGMAGREGTAGTLRARFEDYIHPGSFGPISEPRKYLAMLQMQSRGFSIEIRVRTGMPAPKLSESEALRKYDFALNESENDCMRDVQLGKDSKKRVSDYAVIYPELERAACSIALSLGRAMARA